MNGEDDYLEARAIHLIREAERARAISLDLHEIDSLRRPSSGSELAALAADARPLKAGFSRRRLESARRARPVG